MTCCWYGLSAVSVILLNDNQHDCLLVLVSLLQFRFEHRSKTETVAAYLQSLLESIAKGKGHLRIVYRVDENLSNIKLFHFHVYINVTFICDASTSKRYVVSTYHSIVNVFQVTDTYGIRIAPSTDPDSDGTTTEQTDIHLIFYSSIYIIRVLYFLFDLCNYEYKSTFSITSAVIEIETDNVIEFA